MGGGGQRRCSRSWGIKGLGHKRSGAQKVQGLGIWIESEGGDARGFVRARMEIGGEGMVRLEGP